LEEIGAAPVYKTKITVVGIRRADYATPLSAQKLSLTSPASGGHYVGIYIYILFYIYLPTAIGLMPGGSVYIK
jgi:hypothetical protein